MEERELVSLSTIPPLHKGRSFVCYRDVNKAIERHRELYGLRLALKRAVKLENYCLTIEQMRDLNLRLKYGELDYHCFAATGRPGRPGNDERCPQLIRLKLSADAQSLVVYESHNHNILPFNEGAQKNQQPQLKQKLDFFASLPHDRPCFRGDITLTPINPVQKNPVLILPKPISGGEGQQASQPALTLTKSFFINNNSFGRLTPVPEINSITITPTPPPQPPVRIYPQSGDNGGLDADSHEKITLRIKKSQVVPNEMVVVGSLRDTEEQLKSKVHDGTPSLGMGQHGTPPLQPVNPLPKELMPKLLSQTHKLINEGVSSPSVPSPGIIPKQIANGSLKPGNPPKAISNNLKTLSPNPISKMNATEVTPVSAVRSVGPNKPGLGITRQTPPHLGNPFVRPTLNQSQKVAIRPTSKSGITISTPTTISTAPSTTLATSSATSAITKPTVLKQSPDMKQIFIRKSPQVMDSKPKQSVANKPLSNSISGTGASKSSPNVLTYSGISKPSPNEVRRSLPIGSNKPPVSSGPKPVIKSTPVATTAKPLADKSNGVLSADKRVLPKPIQNPKVSNSKSGVQNPSKKIVNGRPLADRVKPKIFDKNLSNASFKPVKSTESSVNGNVNGGNRLPNVTKKMKRKPGRPPDSYSNTNPVSGTLDTELGYSEKQHLAHGVLLQLLKVTSQLPMAEFSHALDTLEVVTDAFRLGQRVALTIRHDEEDLVENDGCADTLLDRHLRDYALVSSTTVDDTHQNPYAITQIDGQFDADALLKNLSTLASILPPDRREEERRLERMDVDDDRNVIECRRGQKRASAESFLSLVERAKRAKR